MAIFSSRTLTYLRICFLSALSFYLLKDPIFLLEYPLAVLLARSMELPIVQMNAYDPVFGIFSFIIATLALHDLVPLFESNVTYFESIVPSRLLFFFGMAVYCCCGSSFYICNNLVFVYCFFEIFFNVLIFSSLREEKYERIKALGPEIEAENYLYETQVDGNGNATITEIQEEEEEIQKGEDPEFQGIMHEIREQVKDL